jgi:hypothetical protein
LAKQLEWNPKTHSVREGHCHLPLSPAYLSKGGKGSKRKPLSKETQTCSSGRGATLRGHMRTANKNLRATNWRRVSTVLSEHRRNPFISSRKKNFGH